MEYLTAFERTLGLGQEPYSLARNELGQAAETGRDVTALRAEFDALDPGDEAALTEIYERTLALPGPADWPYYEGSDLDGIVARLPAAGEETVAGGHDLAGRLRGAWSGRVVGNMLGKPVEMGWPRARLKEYLLAQDAYPLTDYVPLESEDESEKYGFVLLEKNVTRGRIDGSARDDDVDYTIFGLHLLETYGTAYTSWHVAYEWLRRFPAYQVFTAERAAYQNLVREVPLDRVGEYHNPFREWIGAQIRADIFGYVSPGAPRRAALLAYQDAFLSHRANGIYGEMWAAALIASAFTADSPEESVVRSLDHVPGDSRLAAEVRTVLADYRAGLSWEDCLDRLDARHQGMSWVHTLNNTGVLTAGILWGEGDFTSTIALTVQAGLDTDSTGATAGSWAGAFLGDKAIPPHWLTPLKDRVRSAVFGFGNTTIDSLTNRTTTLVETLRHT
ncbi:ADP-ribosylglycohydrolase family protein [Streptomyces sp. NPDC091292]|uniref:ADP-ribosylglycohydrolase family protein n=1 Tax=Streptomyces sp. NPDC091292 TaxID=3365991 RepID=UPI0037F1FA94